MPTPQQTPLGVSVSGAGRHHGLARQRVHRLKYHADLVAGHDLAEAMAQCVDARWSCLVPVPRALARRLRYGIDPARWLAREVGRLRGVAVVDALVPGVWWPRHAGAGSGSPPHWRPTRPVPPGAALVDDVVTSGATLDAAARLTGARVALVATVAMGPFDPIVV